jgi:hypothetical protein
LLDRCHVNLFLSSLYLVSIQHEKTNFPILIQSFRIRCVKNSMLFLKPRNQAGERMSYFQSIDPLYPLTLLTQTLTHLNLRETQITDSGTQHMAEALKTNKVTSIDLLSLDPCISFFLLFARHYGYYISRIIATSPVR